MKSSIIKNTVLLFVILLIIIYGVATILEKIYGTAFVMWHIYHNACLIFLWMCLIFLGMWRMWQIRAWKRVGMCLLHAAFGIILCGAWLTHVFGTEGTIHLRQQASVSTFQAKDGAEQMTLPFALRLDTFQIKYYPGTQAPADFESHILLTDENGQMSQHVVSMNHTLNVSGYRFYQSSYDPDGRGSILMVSYDLWGRMTTYAGYGLLFLSVIWLLMAPNGRFRSMLRQLRGNTSLLRTIGLLVVIFSVQTMAAAEHIPSISREQAVKMRRQQVVFNDRVMPFNTMAIDFVRKIYGSTHYRGLLPEQVVAGWGLRPDAWKEQPMIRVKNAQLRQRLGIKGQYARFSELFADDGTYRLNDFSEDATLSADMKKAVGELDEKVGLIVMLTQGILFEAAPQKDRLSENRVTAELIYNRLPYFKIFFMLCLTLGFVSLIALTAMYSMRGEVNKTRVGKLSLLAVRTCVWLLIPVALLLLSVYILRWYVSGSLPMANGFETMLTMSLISIFATLLLYRSSYIMLPIGYLAAGFSLLVAHIGQMSPQITHLMPVLNSPLLAMHVSVIMIAYALFFFTFLIAIAAQVLLWRGAETARISHLSLLSRVMLYPAVLLLCAGIFLGAIWADVSWGSYWNWDAKEVWALITLLVYAIPLHQPSFSWLQRPRNYHLFMLLAFLSVLMTYFGVNYVLGGMHSYA